MSADFGATFRASIESGLVIIRVYDGPATEPKAVYRLNSQNLAELGELCVWGKHCLELTTCRQRTIEGIIASQVIPAQEPARTRR